MISSQRVYAVMLRHILQLMRDANRKLTVFFWPFIDIVLIGYLAMYRYGSESHDPVAARILLVSIVLWQVVLRANFDISLNLLEDIWAQNVTNMFGSPLSLTEWIVACFLFALGHSFVLFLFYTLLAWLLFGFFVGSLGWPLVALIVGLFISGIAIGFASSALLIYKGNRVTSLTFMIPWIFAPLSGVYYDVTVFPHFFSSIAYAFPFIYFFDALRIVSKTGTFPVSLWFAGLCLALIYLSVALLFFRYMFDKSKEKGLARLID